MNICFISSYIPKPTAGGVDRVINNLAWGLSRRGYGLSCCYMFRDSEYGHVPDLKCHQFPQGKLYAIAENVDFLVNYIRENNIDILMYEAMHIALWEVCVQAKAITGVKIVCQLHNDPNATVKAINDKFKSIQLTSSGAKRCIDLIYNYIKLPYTYYNRKKHIQKTHLGKLRDCDAYVSLSKFYTPILQHLVGEKSDKLKAIGNPILQYDTHSLEKKKQLVYVGRMVIDTKRPDRALEIWKLLCYKYPDWSLKMVGNGPDLPYLKKYAEKLKLRNVTFTGKADSMKYFAESWISMLTSSHEGFGLVLVEAQQNGCIPIVYNSYESIHDIIDNGKTGFIIPPFNKYEFAKQISKLIEDIELREQLSMSCRDNSSNFDLDIIVDKWERLFKSL